MDPDCDLIEKLLQNTGLSCEELLTKLHQYRVVNSKPTEPDGSSVTGSLSEAETTPDGEQSTTSYDNNAVILETKPYTIEVTEVDEEDKADQETQTFDNEDKQTQTFINENSSQSSAKCEQSKKDHTGDETEIDEDSHEEASRNIEKTRSFLQNEQKYYDCVRKNLPSEVNNVDEDDKADEQAETCDIEDKQTQTFISEDSSQDSAKCEQSKKDPSDDDAEIESNHDEASRDIETTRNFLQNEQKYVCNTFMAEAVASNDEEVSQNLENAASIRENDKDDASDFSSVSTAEIHQGDNKMSRDIESILDRLQSDKDDAEDFPAASVSNSHEDDINGKMSAKFEVSANLSQSEEDSNQENSAVSNTEINEEKISDSKEDTVIHQERTEDSSFTNKNEKPIDGYCKEVPTTNETPSEDNPDITKVIDHNYSNLEPNTETASSKMEELHKLDSSDLCSERDTTPSNADDLPQSEDSLRNTLRMQLSSLRNMKKSSGYLPELKSRSIFFHNLKKKRKSCDVNPMSRLSVDDSEEESRDDENEGEMLGNKDEISTNENSVVSLSDITSRMPLSVDGGTKEGPEDGNETEMLKNKEENSGNENSIVSLSDMTQETRLSGEKGRETENEEESIENKETNNSHENSLVSLSEETEFVILNVTGGVDRLTPDLESENKEEEVTTPATNIDKDKEHADLLNNVNDNASDSSSTIIADTSHNKEVKNILTNYKRKSYFDTSRYKFKNYRSQEKPPNLSVRKNISENFKQDPGINKSVKNSEKSPFVSDSLDDFLSESAQLKISYPIPKLGAEDGIRENTMISPFNDVNNLPKVEQQKVIPKEKPKLMKAKTLAEMRRNFEKLKAKEKLKASTLSPYKRKKLLKELSAKAKEEDGKKIYPTFPTLIKPQGVSSDVSSERSSFILYNNKKLWVPSDVKDKCMGVVSSKFTKDILQEKVSPVSTPKPRATERTSRKPSLLSCLVQNKTSKLMYKPGPLCRKADLQNVESRDQWTTEVKTLPKVYFEVTPRINEPIDPKLVHLLPVFDEVVISEERANFALSVLKPKNEIVEPKAFNFHIPYNNKQEKMVVRKPHQPVPYKANLEKEETDPINAISSVLDDIITYIEIKEIEHTLIKEDDVVVESVEITNESNVKTKVRKAKRKKLDLELLRLNCKVIDVATDETENKNCLKPFCRLGCVCKSLLCEGIFSNHCQLVDCMFGCHCPPPTTTNEMMTANNSLSVHTVNHLQDKAKKDLAKEEREFTQTLIHTDNDVILLGTGKLRRSSKPPKKYTDYVGDETIFDIPQVIDPLKEPGELKKCHIVLQKLDLDDVTPYCLFHNLYNCHCKGEAIDPPPKKIKTVVDQIPKIRIVKTKEDQHKAWYDSCARIRKVFPEYKVRNKDPLYNEKLRIKNLAYKAKTKKEVRVEQNGEANIFVNDVNNFDPKPVQKASKRKQSFDVREDVLLKRSPTKHEKEFALQRRKKKVKPDVFTKKVSLYSAVFDGEIKVSLRDNQDMLSVIGDEHSSLEYLRILPWAKLIENFHSRKLCIWAREKRSSALLCNSAGHFPPKHFIDIRKIEQRSEIIQWILTDHLPADRPRDLMHLILTPKRIHFSIAGYCLKKLNSNKQPTDISVVDNDMSIETSNMSLQQELTWRTKLPSDLLQSSASPKSSESRSSFEELSVGSPEAADTSYDDPEEDANYKLTSFNTILKPTGTTSFRQQSVLISKLLEFGTDASRITSPKQLEMASTQKQAQVQKPPEVKQNLQMTSNKIMKLPVTRTLQQVSRSEVLKKPGPRYDMVQFPVKRTLQPAASKSKINIQEIVCLASPQTVLKLEQKNDHTKLRSLLNTVPSISAVSASVQHVLNTQSALNTNQLELSLSQEESDCVSLVRDTFKETSCEQNRSEEDHSKNNEQDPLEIIQIAPSSSRESYEEDPLLKSNPKENLQDPLEIEITLPQKQSLETNMRPCNKPPSKTDVDFTASQNSVIPSRSLKCTHKDMYNKSKTLILTNRVFIKRKLYYSQDNNEVEVNVPLPRVSKNFRWRLIYLNSDFSFLTFIRPNYSIKYTDLMDVVKMSCNTKSTITLRNKEFSDSYRHPIFGIFCVPDYQDRLFIGPYLPTEKHNIETLRYLQGRLIDTQIFNKMVGKKVTDKDPVWVYETNIPKTLPNGIVIDITEDDEDAVVDLLSDSSEESHPVGSRGLENSLLCPPFVEELTAEEVKSTHNINRYIITNIPHLGYLEACQRDSKAIEVFWPNGSTGYRFPNVTLAKNLLTQYFSQIFYPVPQVFKINVVIMTHLDVQANKPIDSKYFSQPGPYFCGEFGIHEKDTISNYLLKKCNVPSVDMLLRSYQETQEDEDAMIRIFGLFLMSNEELRIHSQPRHILQWALSELYILKKLFANYESEKSDLQNMIRLNAQKLKEKRKELRVQETSNRSLSTNSSVTVSETIEITDSDEEDTEETSPVFKKISVSGRIKSSSFHQQHEDRSLLKPKIWVKSGRSLLKNDKEKQNRQELTTPLEIAETL